MMIADISLILSIVSICLGLYAIIQAIKYQKQANWQNEVFQTLLSMQLRANNNQVLLQRDLIKKINNITNQSKINLNKDVIFFKATQLYKKKDFDKIKALINELPVQSKYKTFLLENFKKSNTGESDAILNSIEAIDKFHCTQNELLKYGVILEVKLHSGDV